MIKGDLHSHSIYDDGKSTLTEMAEAAEDMGLDYFGFSGHSYQTGCESFCIGADRVAEYKAEARALQKQFRDSGKRTRLYVGLELDIFGRPEEGLDYVIGSVHGFETEDGYISIDSSPQQTRMLIDRYFNGDPYRLTDAYYDLLSELPERTACDIIGHFDLPTKFNEKHPVFDINSRRYLKRALEVMKYLVKKGMIFEINTGAMSRGWRAEPYPDSLLLSALHEMGGRITINSDSHHRDTIAHAYDQAICRALQVGFDTIWVLTDAGFCEAPINVKEYENGRILLEPYELVRPDTISERSLAEMDKAVANFKKGAASAPINL